jgi:hypothetical protein
MWPLRRRRQKSTEDGLQLHEAREVARALQTLLEADRAAQKQKALRSYQRTTERVFKDRFASQGRAFVQALEGIKAHFPETTTKESRRRLRESIFGSWQPLWASIAAATAKKTAEALDQVIRGSLLQGATATLTSLGAEGSFDLANPRAVAYLADHAADAVSRIDDTTQAKLADLLTAGLSDGLSYSQIASSITDAFADFGPTRAEVIATYETGQAYEAGSKAVALDLRDSGTAMEKSWLTAGDDRVSDDCEMNEGDGWIPVDEPHSSGDDAPLAHPRCRCTELYRAAGAGDSGGIMNGEGA